MFDFEGVNDTFYYYLRSKKNCENFRQGSLAETFNILTLNKCQKSWFGLLCRNFTLF